MEQTPEDRGRYESVQTEANSKRMGLWNDRNPVPPWEWRDHWNSALGKVEMTRGTTSVSQYERSQKSTPAAKFMGVKR